MSDIKHSAEPWEARRGKVYADNPDERIADCTGYLDDEEAEANAERIRSCVNACKGIPSADIAGKEPGYLLYVLRTSLEGLVKVGDYLHENGISVDGMVDGDDWPGHAERARKILASIRAAEQEATTNVR